MAVTLCSTVRSTRASDRGTALDAGAGAAPAPTPQVPAKLGIEERLPIDSDTKLTSEPLIVRVPGEREVIGEGEEGGRETA